ncbi:MAG: penicillin-binding protein 2 [Alphaproteobacteria bacterium]|nr:MAG: penicillin-binding protein 2 [Alphaproteobacteria bacterium]
MVLKRDGQDQAKTFTRRALLVGGGQAVLMTALGARMYYLQVIEADRYATLAEDNRINLRLIPPPRGRIVDRFGTPMAVNQQNYRVVMVREQARDVTRTLDHLAQIITLSERDYQRILREMRRKRAFVPVTVRDFLDWEQVSRIEVNAPDLPGVSIEVGQTRQYPFGETMTHILGYVSVVSEKDLTGDPLLELPGFRIGKQGIEKQYDGELRGKAGTSHLEVNALGRVIRELSREEGVPGRDLVLTVDVGLQKFVHRRLKLERSASAVVMDVTNGDILALASSPAFDPNIFNVGMSSQIWHDLINDPLSPLTNKALSGHYAPGSTFKMMVALAALEAGIGPDHRVFCPGYMELGNTRFHCWKKYGHGWVDMYDGIKQSCDVFFYDISRRVGIDRIAAMARRFGLGAPTGIDLPGERPGVIPDREWKLANIGEPWQLGETLVSAIGQGFVLTTPIQLAVMTARIANRGRLVRPRLTRLREELAAAAPPGGAGSGTAGSGVPASADAPDASAGSAPITTLDIPDSHFDVIHTAMDLVTNDRRGTAYRARIAAEGREMAGKTGTSQVRRITMAERAAGVFKNEDLPWRRRDHALFVAFAPVHAPRYCCAVVVEHGGGGSKVAAPIARDVLMETQERDPAATPPVRLVAGQLLRKA